jgi:POT family proton-dependent oligopeptide transporter
MGLLFLGIGYLFMVWAGLTVRDGGKASMLLVLLTYFWHTVGELCVSPPGRLYVTKAAPVRFVSLLMGVWFISSFVANLTGGLVAAEIEKIERGEIRLPWRFGGQADFFFLFIVSSLGTAVLVFLLTPLLKRLLRHDSAGIAAGRH